MGASDSKFWWYPDPDGPARELDCGETLTFLDPVFTRDREQAQTASRRFVEGEFGGDLLLRVVWERVPLEDATGIAKYRKAQNLVSHLLGNGQGGAGGQVALCLDASVAFASYVDAVLSRDDATVTTTGQLYPFMAGTLTADNQVRLRSAWPEQACEIVGVSSVSGDTITLGRGLYNNFKSTPTLVREEHTYVAMRLQGDANPEGLLTTEGGLHFTLTLPLVFDAAAFLDHVEAAGQLADTSGSGNLSFEGATDTYSPITDLLKQTLATGETLTGKVWPP